jgi:hypothetical protein
MDNAEKLKELEAIFESMHRQPPLSDKLPDDARFVWVYGEDQSRPLSWQVPENIGHETILLRRKPDEPW